MAIRVRDCHGKVDVKTLYMEPGSPWENGYCESLNPKLRDELLNGEIFTTLREAQVLIENWEAPLQCQRRLTLTASPRPQASRECGDSDSDRTKSPAGRWQPSTQLRLKAS